MNLKFKCEYIIKFLRSQNYNKTTQNQARTCRRLLYRFIIEFSTKKCQNTSNNSLAGVNIESVYGRSYSRDEKTREE